MKPITVREADKSLKLTEAHYSIMNMPVGLANTRAIRRLLRAQQRRIKQMEFEVALLSNDAGSTRLSNFGPKKINAAKPQGSK